MKIFRNNIYHDKRVEHISYKLNVPEEVIEEALDIMYDYIKNKAEVQIEDNLNEEEFYNSLPTFHIPSLGYLKPSYAKYKHLNKNKKNGKRNGE